MGRKRQNDLGLPPRVYYEADRDRFIYRPLVGKATVLEAKTVVEANAEHGRITGLGVYDIPTAAPNSIGQLIKMFYNGRFKELAPDTQASYDRLLKKINRALGDVHPSTLKPKHLYAFIDGVTQSDSTRNILIALFRNLFRMAVKKGMCDTNIARDLEKEPQQGRARVPEIDELEAFKLAQQSYSRVDSGWWGCYIDFKLMTGLRQRDLIQLPPLPQKLGVIQVEMNKSKRWRKDVKKRVGRRLPIEVTEDLLEVIKRIYALDRPQNTQFLFCNAYGRQYKPASFRRAYERAMKRYLKLFYGPEEKAKGPESDYWFREHDIRATVASADPKNAQQRLGHMYEQTTTRYLRELHSMAEKNPVKPLSANLLHSLREEPKTTENIHHLNRKKAK
jgi:integrase